MNLSHRSVAEVLSHRRGIGVLASVLFLTAIGFGANTIAQGRQAHAYAVRLHRPATVGRHGRVISTGVKHMVTTVESNGRVVRNTTEDLHNRFEAVETVTSVESRGKPVRSEYVIERFESTTPTGVQVLVPRGQTLVVVRGEASASTQVTVAGQPVDAPVRAAVGTVVSMSTQGATDDEAFGNAQPQTIGATWGMNAELAAHDLATTAGIQSTISGHTHIVRRAMFQNVDCLEIGAEMTGNITAIPALPAGSTVRVGTMNAHFHAMLPVDTALPTLSSGQQMQMNVVVDMIANGQPTQLHIEGGDQRDETFTAM